MREKGLCEWCNPYNVGGNKGKVVELYESKHSTIKLICKECVPLMNIIVEASKKMTPEQRAKLNELVNEGEEIYKELHKDDTLN